VYLKLLTGIIICSGMCLAAIKNRLLTSNNTQKKSLLSVLFFEQYTKKIKNNSTCQPMVPEVPGKVVI
jgi:hypothetical protein